MNIKYYKGFMVDDDLNIYSKRTGLKLKPHLGSDGYMQVIYRDESQKSIHERVHVIYAHAFIPNPNNYKYINHIDSNKTNNCLDNLEWCTNSHNVKHGWDNNGRKRHNFPVASIDRNGNKKEYISIRELCNDLKLDRHKVSRILKGEIKNNYEYDFVYM